MKEEISISELEEVISGIFGVKVPIPAGFYYKFELNRIMYVCFTENPLTTEFPTGFVIMDRINDEWFLYPSIIDLLKVDRNEVISSNEKIAEITNGKQVELHVEDGLIHLKDGNSRSLAIGHVFNRVFSPIVDIGVYLRHESLS